MSLMRKYTKKEAVSIAIQGARLYKENFIGRNLLFIMTDKHKRVSKLEVEFAAAHYMHLTGLRPRNRTMSSLDFYNFCLDGRISDKDIEFAADGTTHQKLAVLLYVLRYPSLSANTAGNFNNSRPYLQADKMTGGVKWAVGFRMNNNKSGYVPVTLLEGDIRDLVNQQFRIVATYRRIMGTGAYDECVYTAKKVEWDKLTYPDDWGDLPKPGVDTTEENVAAKSENAAEEKNE